MVDLNKEKRQLEYNVSADEFLKEIYQLFDDLYAAHLSYVEGGIVMTFSNGQKFAISLDELK